MIEHTFEKLLTTLLLLFVACQPLQTPEELLQAQLEDQVPTVKIEDHEALVAWATQQILSSTTPPKTWYGSPAKSDVMFLVIQELANEVDRHMWFKATKPTEWANYKTEPPFQRTLFGVTNQLSKEEETMLALTHSNKPAEYVKKAKEIFIKFKSFIKE